jgi:hypothetical protein
VSAHGSSGTVVAGEVRHSDSGSAGEPSTRAEGQDGPHVGRRSISTSPGSAITRSLEHRQFATRALEAWAGQAAQVSSGERRVLQAGR